MDIIKIPIFILLAFLIFTLFQGGYYQAKDEGVKEKPRVVRSLTLRIVLSLLLFVLLIAGYLSSIIQPHGLT